MAMDHGFLIQYSRELFWLVIPSLLVFVSIRLFRRFGGLPTILLLIGSAALLLGRIVGMSIGLILLPYTFTHPNGWAKRVLWPTCTENPALDFTRDALMMSGIAFFYVGFLWFAVRITRRGKGDACGVVPPRG